MLSAPNMNSTANTGWNLNELFWKFETWKRSRTQRVAYNHRLIYGFLELMGPDLSLGLDSITWAQTISDSLHDTERPDYPHSIPPQPRFLFSTPGSVVFKDYTMNYLQRKSSPGRTSHPHGWKSPLWSWATLEPDNPTSRKAECTQG